MGFPYVLNCLKNVHISHLLSAPNLCLWLETEKQSNLILRNSKMWPLVRHWLSLLVSHMQAKSVTHIYRPAQHHCGTACHHASSSFGNLWGWDLIISSSPSACCTSLWSISTSNTFYSHDTTTSLWIKWHACSTVFHTIKHKPLCWS